MGGLIGQRPWWLDLGMASSYKRLRLNRVSHPHLYLNFGIDSLPLEFNNQIKAGQRKENNNFKPKGSVPNPNFGTDLELGLGYTTTSLMPSAWRQGLSGRSGEACPPGFGCLLFFPFCPGLRHCSGQDGRVTHRGQQARCQNFTIFILAEKRRSRSLLQLKTNRNNPSCIKQICHAFLPAPCR